VGTHPKRKLARDDMDIGGVGDKGKDTRAVKAANKGDKQECKRKEKEIKGKVMARQRQSV
jgi:hypothetical protein